MFNLNLLLKVTHFLRHLKSVLLVGSKPVKCRQTAAHRILAEIFTLNVHFHFVRT